MLGSLASVGTEPVGWDGEIVCLDEDGSPDLAALEELGVNGSHCCTPASERRIER